MSLGLRGKRLPAQPGRLLIIGFDGTEMSPRLRSLLARVQPAGIILFARNIKTAAQTCRLLRECQKCVALPLFTCVDLEGGTVDRFRDVLGAAPSAAEVFATGDRRLFRKHGQLIGANCCAFGFNVDFAPVLDLAFPASEKVMGSRVVSSDPRETIAYAREFLAGLRASKVLGCGKHFPGLGDGPLDSHLALPVIEKSLSRLWSEDLVPYGELRRQLPFAMIGHAAYPQVTRDRTPASLSRIWISDILRQRIGYRNLIVSDDLEMGGVLTAAPIGEAAIESIRAGSDLCLVCHHEDAVVQVCDALVSACERDTRFARSVTQAARRIAAAKKKCANFLRTGRRGGVRKLSPTAIEKLSRNLWEFSEQVRLGRFSRRDDRARQS